MTWLAVLEDACDKQGFDVTTHRSSDGEWTVLLTPKGVDDTFTKAYFGPTQADACRSAWHNLDEIALSPDWASA